MIASQIASVGTDVTPLAPCCPIVSVAEIASQLVPVAGNVAAVTSNIAPVGATVDSVMPKIASDASPIGA